MRKIIIFLAFVLTLGVFTPVALAANEIGVTINGQVVQFDVPPQIIDGRTMVPMRAIFEILGATVHWNNEYQTVTAITGDGSEIRLTINDTSIHINGLVSTMDIAPQLVNGSTMVPVRLIAEAMGMNVNWNVEANTVEITRPPAKVISIATGLNASMAVTDDGTLWDIRGANPFEVMSNVAVVSVGEAHVVAVQNDGSLWAWGDNWFGQLGGGNYGIYRYDHINSVVIPYHQLSPMRVMNNIIDVSVSPSGPPFTMAVTSDGRLLYWGTDSFIDPVSGMHYLESLPNPIWIMDDVIAAFAGDNDKMALRADGNLWAWYLSRQSYVGAGLDTRQRISTYIMGDVATVSTRHGNTLVIRADGTLLAWGNRFGGFPVRVMDGVLSD